MIWVEGLGTSPLTFLLMSVALKSMDPALEESASTSGAGWLVTLRRVILPLMLPAVLSVMLIVFLRALEAFEVPVVIGLPGRVRVLTSRIHLALAKSPQDSGSAGALASLFLALSVILYIVIVSVRELSSAALLTSQGACPGGAARGRPGPAGHRPTAPWRPRRRADGLSLSRP